MKRRWVRPVILSVGAIAALLGWVVFDAHGRSFYYRLPDLYQYRDAYYVHMLWQSVSLYHEDYGFYPESLDDPELLEFVEGAPGPDLSQIEYVRDPETSAARLRFAGTHVQRSWVPLVPSRKWEYIAETDEGGRFRARWVE